MCIFQWDRSHTNTCNPPHATLLGTFIPCTETDPHTLRFSDGNGDIATCSVAHTPGSTAVRCSHNAAAGSANVTVTVDQHSPVGPTPVCLT